MPETRVKTPRVRARTLAMARAAVRVRSDETGCLGVRGGHGEGLSGSGGSDGARGAAASAPPAACPQAGGRHSGSGMLRAMRHALRRHPVRWSAFRLGARRVVRSLPAMAAWGLVTGVAMVNVGLELLPALGMTFVVYSGTSQLTVLPLLAAGTGVLAMTAAAAVANLRFVVYSALMSRHLRRLPLALRLGTGFWTIDAAVAAFLQQQQEGPLVQRVAFLNGANALIAAVWCVSSVVGIALAAVLPLGAELAYIGLLALFGITVPLLAGRPAWAAAAASVAVALAGADWPHRLGTFAAVVAGVAAALWAGRGRAAP